jgi:hypothetical protein
VSWRNCRASETLVDAVNAKWPRRDKASDGTIGDARHATRDSDHNPWVIVDDEGVVRARDIDKDGIRAAWLAEQLRKLGEAGDKRLANGGYIIYNGRITSPDFKRWLKYTGRNSHKSHIHVSFSRQRSGFDSGGAWHFLRVPDQPSPSTPKPRPKPPTPKPSPTGRPTIRQGSTGRHVRDLQAHLRRVYPLYAGNLAVDGVFGPSTRAAVVEFQRRARIPADGVVGPQTWHKLRI